MKELMATMFDPTAVDSLEAEANMLCSIHHPNIVRFFGMSIDSSHQRGLSYYLGRWTCWH